MELIYLIFGLLVGGVLGYLYASRQVAVLKSNMALQSRHADELRTEDLRNFQQRIKELEAEQEKNKAAEQKLLTAQFENLANQILKSNSSEFKEMSANSLKVLLDPLNDKIKDFKDRVEKCYGDEAKERYSLQQEINKLIQENQKISVDANNLANALKGESKTQGDWGEMILADILQKSGLKEGEQYFPQNTIRDENGELLKSDAEQLMRPDMVVVYPGERKIIIDSKVSLTAYVDYVNTEDKNTEKQKLKEHLASIKKHIDELSAKDYSKYDVKTPEFVMMFIPNESAYYVAVKSDPNLWNYAYQKKVVLMNQTNLITALRLALDLWRRDAQEKNIMEIVKVGSDLYDKFVLFTENFSKVGDSLDKARQCYDDALGQLSIGKGNLIGRAERLRGLGISPKKALPKTESGD